VDVTDLFLIEKRGLYYRPESAGYTGIKDEAGRYPFEEAAERSCPNGPDGPRDGITIWRESEAPDYSGSCCPDVKAKHQLAAAIARAEAAEAEVARLQKALQLYAGGDTNGMGINWEPIDDRGAVARAALTDPE
jgi:hypothetical protein